MRVSRADRPVAIRRNGVAVITNVGKADTIGRTDTTPRATILALRIFISLYFKHKTTILDYDGTKKTHG
jgi:hypothetical protein